MSAESSDTQTTREAVEKAIAAAYPGWAVKVVIYRWPASVSAQANLTSPDGWRSNEAETFRATADAALRALADLLRVSL